MTYTATVEQINEKLDEVLAIHQATLTYKQVQDMRKLKRLRELVMFGMACVGHPPVSTLPDGSSVKAHNDRENLMARMREMREILDTL